MSVPELLEQIVGVDHSLPDIPPWRHLELLEEVVLKNLPKRMFLLPDYNYLHQSIR